MDIAARNTILELLPSELIAEILAMLDCRDLVSCMQVRRLSPFLLSKFGPRSSIRVLFTACRVGRCAGAFSI
jgi:F-box domain